MGPQDREGNDHTMRLFHLNFQAFSSGVSLNRSTEKSPVDGTSEIATNY
jgi:hypothetical protein